MMWAPSVADVPQNASAPEIHYDEATIKVL
jgi:hypothetical protein